MNVQATIGEDGNVISAKAINGTKEHRLAAERAARAAKFGITKLSGAPVKVSGVIVYSFKY